jgi:hypothetical protein
VRGCCSPDVSASRCLRWDWRAGREQRAESGSPAFRAMLTYNVLIALYLAYLGTVGHLRGVLLWPAVGLHAVVALLLVWTWRDE